MLASGISIGALAPARPQDVGGGFAGLLAPARRIREGLTGEIVVTAAAAADRIVIEGHRLAAIDASDDGGLGVAVLVPLDPPIDHPMTVDRTAQAGLVIGSRPRVAASVST